MLRCWLDTYRKFITNKTFDDCMKYEVKKIIIVGIVKMATIIGADSSLQAVIVVWVS